MKNKLSKKIQTAFFLIFLAGIFTGGALTVFLIRPAVRKSRLFRRGNHNPGRMVKKISSKLQLNKEQSVKLKHLLHEMRERVMQENKQNRKKIKDIINSTFNNIETFLTERQKVKLRKLKKNLPILKRKKFDKSRSCKKR